MPKQATEVTAMDIDSGDAGGSSGKEDKEVYESTMDATFQKFADRVGQNPDQCIRYEFGGQPLLYSKNDVIGKLLHTHGDEGKNYTRQGHSTLPKLRSGPCLRGPADPACDRGARSRRGRARRYGLGHRHRRGLRKGLPGAGVAPGEAGYVEEWAGVQWEELMSNR